MAGRIDGAADDGTAERAAARRVLIGQLLRYAVNGAMITALHSGVYWGLSHFSTLPLQVCNLAAYLCSVCVGYVVHSRVTFRGHGARGRGAQVRFVLASLPGLALNALWVWLLTKVFHQPDWSPIVLFATATPLVVFAINRWWVFR